MPKKQKSMRSRALAAHFGTSCGSATPPLSMKGRVDGEDTDLAQAILASRAYALENGSCKSSLEQVLEFSRATAAAEAEEAEALRLAVEASLADSKQKELGLGLQDVVRSGLVAEVAANCSASLAQTLVLGESREGGSSAAAEASPSMCSLSSQIEDAAKAAAEAVRVVHSTPSRILKVTYKHDTRRLRTEWTTSAAAAEVLAIIQATVEEGFGLLVGSFVQAGYVLKYHDDEGDLCTLVEGTLMDCLDMALKSNSLRIVLQKLSDVKKPESMEDFSIATPPATPRSDLPTFCSQTIEDDYDSAWSLVEEP